MCLQKSREERIFKPSKTKLGEEQWRNQKSGIEGRFPGPRKEEKTKSEAAMKYPG
jgi:hypothetical protein